MAAILSQPQCVDNTTFITQTIWNIKLVEMKLCNSQLSQAKKQQSWLSYIFQDNAAKQLLKGSYSLWFA